MRKSKNISIRECRLCELNENMFVKSKYVGIEVCFAVDQLVVKQVMINSMILHSKIMQLLNL